MPFEIDYLGEAAVFDLNIMYGLWLRHLIQRQPTGIFKI